MIGCVLIQSFGDRLRSKSLVTTAFELNSWSPGFPSTPKTWAPAIPNAPTHARHLIMF